MTLTYALINCPSKLTSWSTHWAERSPLTMNRRTTSASHVRILERLMVNQFSTLAASLASMLVFAVHDDETVTFIPQVRT